MATTSISLARHRATLAKRTLAFGSVLAFAVTIGLARANHPARAAAPASGSIQAPAGFGDSTASGSANTSANGGFGQADLGPASSPQTPSISTAAS